MDSPHQACECGFSAQALANYLGGHWVRLERITDACRCLRLDDLRRIEVLMDDFERVFPQAFFAVYFGVMPLGLNVSELGFWLLNQGAFNTPSIQKRNDFGTVMVVDPETKSFALSLGYSIEAFFRKPHVLKPIFEAAAWQLGRLDYAGATERVLSDMSRVLRQNAHRSLWTPEVPAGPVELAVEPLRHGHQAHSPRPRTRSLTPN